MELIATLGSNPLPVVVTALQLRPPRLHLICTTQVEPLAERVRGLVETKGIGRGEVLTLSDPAQLSSEQLEAELRASTIPWGVCDLDYTGGTKLIAAEVRAWWRRKNPVGTAIYLSEGGHLIFSPARDGFGSARVSVSLSFKELAELHFKYGLACGDEHNKSPHREIAQHILDFVCRKEPEGREGFSEWTRLLPPVRLPSFEHNGVTYQNADGMLTKNCGSGGPLVRHDLTAMFNTIGVAGTTLDDASLMKQPEDVLKAIREDGWAGYDQARSFGLPHLRGASAASTLNLDGKPGPSQTLDDALRGWVNA